MALHIEKAGDMADDNSNSENIKSTISKGLYTKSPFGISVDKEIYNPSPEETVSSNIGLGGKKGSNLEVFLRKKHHVEIPQEDGDPEQITNSFWDAGYMNATISNPGEGWNLYNDPFSKHQKNVNYFGARTFHQLVNDDETDLYSTASTGITTDGDPFAETTLSYKKQLNEWNVSSAAQASYSDNTPQFDVKLGAERYFDASPLSTKFSAAAQGTINPDEQYATVFAQLDARPENWMNGQNWAERNISTSFTATTNIEESADDIIKNSKLSAGLCTDLPLGRLCLDHNTENSTKLLLKGEF